jgi:hypothetical protein
MTIPKQRKPFHNAWIGKDIPQATTIEPRVIKRVLRSLDQIRRHAARAPFPNPDRVAQHGEREVLISSFAMIEGMAASVIDWIGDQTATFPTTARV